MVAASGTKKTHTIAKFVGHSGTRRVISKADQDKLIGVNGAAKTDLVWEKGNRKVDVTDVHEDVLEYLKGDSEFRLSHAEVPVDSAASTQSA